MSNLQALMTVLEHAERERDFAFTEQQRAQNALQGAQRQAEQLVSYRGEYQQRWSAQFQRAGSMEIVQCYQGFMGRLQFAVDQQHHHVALSTAALEAARDALRAHEMRVASIRKLIERRQQEQARAADRRDQKATDEQAARAAWRRLKERNQPLAGGVQPA